MTAQETNVVNAVSTTLTATMSSGATSATVASTSGMPSVPFYVVIDPDDPAKREYMLIDDSASGTTISMTSTGKRNLSGSAGAVEHASGATVRVTPPMKQMFDDLHDRVDLVLKPSSVAAGDVPYVASVASGQATYGRVGIGASGLVLVSNGSVPGWAYPTLTMEAGVLGGNVTLTADTTVDILSTASLSTGTWDVEFACGVTSATSSTEIEFLIAAGTATATITQVGAQVTIPTNNAKEQVVVKAKVVVTVAGTVKLRGHSATNASTALQSGAALSTPVTGYTAQKVAP